jgi:hypothetical protein
MGGESLSKAGKTLGKAGGKDRAKSLSATKRKAIAKKGGKAGGRGRSKK